MKTVRCAIYTRKSSDEGLEQDFNSLDAQREACAAYILSQASEGWKLVAQTYDDGGLSGGTLKRPALQRLLGDIRNGGIDIIVVYKVDRLTRSLLDFAKLVDTFDAANTSFVSVTQSFNTTTSMGRLTLNMLLSFAQFEREVTAERIRDKIAASKAKGMWMGGIPPLGYRPDGRSLAIVEEHAAMVRDIFRRYLALGNVRHLADALEKHGILTPPRITRRGQAYGGCTFTRGQLYAILRNPIYVGLIQHKDKRYQGNHPAIIEQILWDDVQAQLTAHIRGTRQAREKSASLLAGLLFDSPGEPLMTVHTNKGKLRYRYYVSKAHQHGIVSSGSPALRLPAREIEQVVRQELAALLADPLAFAQRCELTIAPTMLNLLERACGELRAQLETSRTVSLKTFMERIILHPDRLEFAISVTGLSQLLGVPMAEGSDRQLTHLVQVRLTRTGRAVRLVQDDGVLATSTAPDPALIKLLVKARRWWSELQGGNIEIKSLAIREKVSPSYITRVVRLAFLSPDVVEALLAGQTRAELDGTALLATGMIAGDWKRQAAALLPRRS